MPAMIEALEANSNIQHDYLNAIGRKTATLKVESHDATKISKEISRKSIPLGSPKVTTKVRYESRTCY